MKKVLSIVRGVYVSGVGIELSWGSDKPLLTQIFTAIDRVAEEHNLKVVVVFDELQRAVGGVGLAIQRYRLLLRSSEEHIIYYQRL